jgi:HNH endonuclease
VPTKPHPWTVERLLGRLDESTGPDRCWQWLGATRNGYGKIICQADHKRTYVTAHRLAWELFNGPIPPGLDVLHRCDNPACCNPAHLFLGTHSDNMRDREAKGRHNAPRGSNHGRAKLTEDDVRTIRRLVAEGTPQNVLARRYGVTTTILWLLVHRRTWRHVE